MSEKLEPKVGAWVHISSRHNNSLAKIEKVGKIHFVAGGQKFRNNDGWLASSDTWALTRAEVITEELANELMAKFALNRNGHKAKEFISSSVKSMTNEDAIKVSEYIKSLQQ